MKKTTHFRGLTVFVFLAGVVVAQSADGRMVTPAPSERALPASGIPDRYLVQVAPGIDAVAVARAHGVAPTHVYQAAVRGFAGVLPPGRLAALRADPRVLHVVPDRRVVAIGRPSGGDKTSTGQVVPEGVKRIGAAPGSLGYTGAGVGVAVVDSGVDLQHADLQPLGGLSFSAFGGSAHDGNGHGTHVAGTIAARHNAIDVVGVAPAATIFAVKVLDASGSGSDAGVVAGLDWVAQNATLTVPPIRVVNMSLGRAGTIDDNPLMRASVKALHAGGIAVIVAAGNDAALEVANQVPAAYPEAIASTTAKAGSSQYRLFSGVIAADTASYFTSDGAYDAASGVGVAVSAPGEEQEDITKAGFIQSVGILSTKLGGGTTRLSGTSMAAPHAAGVAALVYGKNPVLGAEDVRDRLMLGAVGRGTAPFDSPTTSYSFDGVREGILNAPGALAAP